MSAKIVFAKRVLAVLIVLLSLFSHVLIQAQSVSLAWNPSPSPTVAGYGVFYGLASGEYSSYMDAGNNTNVTVSGLIPGLTFYFAVSAYDSNQVESPLSNEIIYSIPMPPMAPVITSQLVDQSIAAGANVNLDVGVIGTRPFTFQWFYNGTAIVGSGKSLQLVNFSDADAGDYSVVISNSLGSVTSSVATLSVMDPPVITSQPVAQSVVAGANVNLSAGVIGTRPFTFQWFYNGTAIAGGGKSLQLNGVSDADAGDYSVVISNGAGSVTSSVATLSVMDPPAITTQPVAQSVAAGANVSLNVGVLGTQPFTFQWFYNGTAMVGGGQSLQLDNVSDANAGDYSVVISNSLGSVTSSMATLSVIDPPVITTQPVAQSVAAGANVNFNVGVTGTRPLTFQWFYNGTSIVGSGKTLELDDVNGADAGSYYVTIQNAAGMVTSVTVTLTVTNVFVPLAGAYNGLFYQTNGLLPDITVQTAGFLGNCVVGTDGTYTASVWLDGFDYPLTGALDANGNDSEVVSRAANGLANLNVVLHLDMTGATQMITGSISNMDTDNPWTAPLQADLATNALPVPAGNFNMLIMPPSVSQKNSPTASGAGVLINSVAGVVTCIAMLADGTVVSQTVPVSNNGTIPLYFSLYGGLGLAEGWVNLASGVPGGTLTWIRPGGITTTVPYPKGFTNIVTIN